MNRCVVPYLYGYSDYRRHGRLPFGQLDHGDAGITTDLQLLLGVDNEKKCLLMLRLASLEAAESQSSPLCMRERSPCRQMPSPKAEPTAATLRPTRSRIRIQATHGGRAR